MKKCFFTILVILSLTNSSFCQEPDAFFKINCRNFSPDLKEVTTNYTFSSFTTNDIIYFNSNMLKKINQDRVWLKEGYFYFSICCKIPKKSEIIVLKIFENRTKKSMLLFIRCSYNFDWGEYLEINNLNFYEGNYFFDMCNSKKKFRINGESENSVIDCENLNNHLICLKKLKRLIKKYDCK
jgi:hypothetical protein